MFPVAALQGEGGICPHGLPPFPSPNLPTPIDLSETQTKLAFFCIKWSKLPSLKISCPPPKKKKKKKKKKMGICVFKGNFIYGLDDGRGGEVGEKK